MAKEGLWEELLVFDKDNVPRGTLENGAKIEDF